MTIFFPDVSSYTPNVDPAKYPILLARATLSSTFTDGTYAGFKAKSAAAGTFFVAYHWLNHGNLAAQAAHCFSVVGPGVPVMIDAEDEPKNTGYNGPLTIADITGFAAEYRKLGGTVSLCYLPFWYWSGAMSAPRQLDQLATAGLHLVSSNYPNVGYTETGPGWNAYYFGAPAPVQWQYTSTPVDMNAFRGTVADYKRMVGADMELTDPTHFVEVNSSGVVVPKDPAIPVERLWQFTQLAAQGAQAAAEQARDAVKALSPADPSALDAAVAKALPAALASALADPATMTDLGAAIVAAFKKS
jgi:hypothetical protein